MPKHETRPSLVDDLLGIGCRCGRGRQIGTFARCADSQFQESRSASVGIVAMLLPGITDVAVHKNREMLG